MATYIDASEMASISPSDVFDQDYPTPDNSCEASSPMADVEPSKKKRKAWGQPVPPINPILPPRKRAKTAEEKEQRKNERILRNRRAADKSRQRQKAAVADLEKRQIEIEAENAQLKQILSQYENQFGTIPGCEFSPQIGTTTTLSLSVPTPSSLNDNQSHHPDELLATPTLTSNASTASVYPGSPALVPTLSLGESVLLSGPVSSSGMTQYPAEILCDLQCQPEKLTSRLRFLTPSNQLYEVLTLIHYLLTWMSSSERTLSIMSLAFHHLVKILSTTSNQLDYLIQTNFHLIHILISMPATTTQPAVFRLKLLSRLLACNPNLALLLEKAADQALQQKVSQENWMDDADARWAWSSLMTIKWSIKSLEREHSKIRAEVRAGVYNRQKWVDSVGVDYGAVEVTASLWENVNHDRICTTMMSDADNQSLSSTQVH